MNSSQIFRVFLLIAAGLIASAMNKSWAQEPSGKHNDSSKKSSGNSAALRTGKRSIEEALKEKCSVDFTDTTLADAVGELKKQHHLEIQFDRRALKEATIDPTTAHIAQLKLSGVSLRSALQYLLSFWDLAMVVEDEVLLITTRYRANETVETHVYDVQDLVTQDSGNGARPDFDSLIDLITSTVAAAYWDSVGGQGTIEPIGDGSLVICQTAEVHEQISQLFSAIRKVREQTKGGNFTEVFCESPGPLEKAIESALNKTVDFTFDEIPLVDVAKTIRQHYGIELQFDVNPLKDASVDPMSTIISQHVRAISLRSALNRCLGQHELTCVIQNQMLIVTTRDKAKSILDTRLYPIDDLVQRSDRGDSGPENSTTSDASEFVSMIRSTIDPPTWSEVGGEGVVVAYDNGTILIVSQSQATQEKTANILAQLREVHKNRQPLANTAPMKPEAQETAVIRVYELCASAPGALTMTPQEVTEVVKGLVQPKTWTQPDRYIRGVTGKLVVRQLPECSQGNPKTASRPRHPTGRSSHSIWVRRLRWRFQ